jgi:hypothetical protein
MGVGVRASVAAAVVVCAAAVGCSLVIPLDDLRGDASLADVANDTIVPPDAADAGNDGSSTACPTIDGAAVFCDNFDDSDGSTFTHWSATYTSTAATVARVGSDASAPFAVRFATLPNPDGGSPQSELQRVFLTAPTSKITYGFSVRIGQYLGGVHIQPVTLHKGDPLSSIDYLSISASSTTFSEQVYNDAGTATYANHALTDSLVSGDWVRVVMQWTIGDGGVTALVTFNGSPVTAPIPLDPRVVIGSLQIAAGISSVVGYADAGAQIDVDDVVVTVE